MANMNQRNKLDRFEENVIKLEHQKVDSQDFNELKENLDGHMKQIEQDLDKSMNKAKSLENWIDIYMPLRLQHQITETIKPTLPTKQAKTLLGRVDKLICDKLKERIVTDIGEPQLQQRCLDVVERLQLDARILCAERRKQVKEAVALAEAAQLDEEDVNLNKPPAQK